LEGEAVSGTAVPAKADGLASYWPLLLSAHTVQGASGPICLNSSGNPFDKLVPVVTVTGSGRMTVQPAWPLGQPPQLLESQNGKAECAATN
jgi:hypothetical protein